MPHLRAKSSGPIWSILIDFPCLLVDNLVSVHQILDKSSQFQSSLVNFSQFWSASSSSYKTKTHEFLTERMAGQDYAQPMHGKEGSSSTKRHPLSSPGKDVSHCESNINGILGVKENSVLVCHCREEEVVFVQVRLFWAGERKIGVHVKTRIFFQEYIFQSNFS